MSEYIANDGERLDAIVYRHYGTLVPFVLVLMHNPHLHKKETLKSGDKVYLPQWQPPKIEEAKTLWS